MFNRDSPNRSWLKQHIEELWTKFSAVCADSNFCSQAMHDFHGTVWPMQLAVHLMENGHELERPRGHGPDIFAAHPQRVWIEAINVSSGIGADRVPPRVYGQVCHLPEREILLRMTAAIAEKHRKYQGYVGTIIPEREPFVIALNAGCVPDADLTPTISFIEKALLGLDSPSWSIAIPSGEATLQHLPRTEVAKRNTSVVPTTGFLNNSMEGISAVAYTPHHIADTWDKQGRDLLFLHNPFARNPLPQGFLRVGKEKWVENDLLYERKWS